MKEPSVYGAPPAMDELNYDSNLVLGLFAGGIAMGISAVLWGLITFYTQFQISFMAIGVGYFVGIAIQKFGKGNSMIFGISGAVLSFLGCALGNFFFYAGLIAKEGGVSFLEVLLALSLDPAAIVEVFTVTFEIMDLLFYGIAAYIGLRVAITKSVRLDTQKES